MQKKKIHLIAGARPNFMKIAPLYHALKREPWVELTLIHTGQHYDASMSDNFLRDLRLPRPDHNLEVGSGSHSEQTGKVMLAYDKLCLTDPPDWTVVVGDVNSTVACAMVCVKRWIPVIHLEAGLRSGDRRMPEEINRLITDAIADVLWTPSPDADVNLLREGISPDKIDCVGNIMMDSFELLREAIETDCTRTTLGLDRVKYGVLTLHRPSNVDSAAELSLLVDQICKISAELPFVFPVHPRTRQRLQQFNLLQQLEVVAGIRLTEPLGYIQFMNLLTGATVAVTDSGGVQEETTYLGVPCLTVRENTERPVTVNQGSNRLIKPAELAAAVERVLLGHTVRGKRPDLWDGQTADRCVSALKRRLSRDPQ